MITAIIRNKENTLVLELPHSIYDIYEKLQSIGIMQPPKQIPLTDNEDEDIGVKLFSESDFGQHLLLTLNEKNTIADANMLTLVIGATSEDIKEELEQNVLYDQYDSMDEVISAVRQMTQDSGPVKAVFLCPLIGNIDEGERAALEALKGTAQMLLDRIAAAKAAAEADEITAVDGITKDNVKFGDKEALETAEKALEGALRDFDGNYTDKEQEDLEKKLGTVKAALAAIDKAEKAADEIGKLPPSWAIRASWTVCRS